MDSANVLSRSVKAVKKIEAEKRTDREHNDPLHMFKMKYHLLKEATDKV